MLLILKYNQYDCFKCNTYLFITFTDSMDVELNLMLWKHSLTDWAMDEGNK
jgi:hypothetical protein